MSAPNNAAAELALVNQALTSGLSNCVEWLNDRTAIRIRNDKELQGLTPEGIKAELLAFIAGGGSIQQVAETRPEYSHYDYYYKAIVPVSGFPRGLFVEMILSDDDPDVPRVSLVNAHPQKG